MGEFASKDGEGELQPKAAATRMAASHHIIRAALPFMTACFSGQTFPSKSGRLCMVMSVILQIALSARSQTTSCIQLPGLGRSARTGRSWVNAGSAGRAPDGKPLISNASSRPVRPTNCGRPKVGHPSIRQYRRWLPASPCLIPLRIAWSHSAGVLLPDRPVHRAQALSPLSHRSAPVSMPTISSHRMTIVMKDTMMMARSCRCRPRPKAIHPETSAAVFLRSRRRHSPYAVTA